jgi:hypothetical protein
MRQRPLSVTIFGILNIGFGGLGLLVLLISLFIVAKGNMADNPLFKQMNQSAQAAEWTKISTPLNGAGALAAMTAGAGLLLLQNWGRILSIIYAIFSIVLTAISCAVVVLGGGTAIVMVASILVSLFGLVYPILLIYFMTRQRVIAACMPIPPVA